MLVYRDLPGSVGPIYSDAQPPSWLLALTSDESLSSDLLNSSLYLHHSGPKSHPHLLSGGLHRTSYRLSETLAPCQVSALALILPSITCPTLPYSLSPKYLLTSWDSGSPRDLWPGAGSHLFLCLLFSVRRIEFVRLVISCKVTLQNFTNLPLCSAKLSIFTDLFFKIFLVQLFGTVPCGSPPTMKQGRKPCCWWTGRPMRPSRLSEHFSISSGYNGVKIGIWWVVVLLFIQIIELKVAV